MTPQIPKRLNDAITSGDIALARSILIGLLNRDFSLAEHALQYAGQKLPSLIETHDGNFYPINNDPGTWTEDYWHGITRDQMKNFSSARFDHLIVVGGQLFPERAIINKIVQSAQHEVVSGKIGGNDSTDSEKVRYEYVNEKLNPKDAKTMERLDAAIREQDVVMARSIIIGLANKNFAEAGRAFFYAVERMPELLQQHDGDLYPMSKENSIWTEDYWHGITRDLMKNFSKERFEHLCEVGAQVLPKKSTGGTSPPVHAPKSQQSESHQSGSSNRMVYIALAIGIVIVVPWIVWILFF
ncbi:MAG: hypothetical protein WCK54_14865 [Desulfuromonadales bacterium]